MALCGTCVPLTGRLTCKAFTAAQPQQRTVSATMIRAVQQTAEAEVAVTSRRAALSALSSVPAALIASRAWALIPDDDDEDLIEKAKAKRGQKLKEELGTQKKFVRSEGFKDTSLAPVQKAVQQLAVVGSQLTTGDLNGVQTTLSGAWFTELDASAKSSPDWKDFTPVCKSIISVRDTAKGGNLPATKAKYVSAVNELQKWSVEAGIASGLRGL